MYFYALQETTVSQMHHARTILDNYANKLRMEISTKFTASWDQSVGFYANVIKQGWNMATSQRLDSAEPSAREIWILGWYDLIRDCVKLKLFRLHKGGDPGFDENHAALSSLLEYGAFKPSDESETVYDVFIRIIPTGDVVDRYLEWLSHNPTAAQGGQGRAGNRRNAEPHWEEDDEYDDVDDEGESGDYSHASGSQSRATSRTGHSRPASRTGPSRPASAMGPSRPASAAARHSRPASPAGPPPPEYSTRPQGYGPKKPRRSRHVTPDVKFVDVVRHGKRAGQQQARLSRKVVPLPPRTPPLAAKLAQLEQRLARSEQSANMEHLLTRLLSHLDLA